MKNFGNKKWIFRGAVYAASASIATLALPVTMQRMEPPIKIEARALTADVSTATFSSESPTEFSEDTEEDTQSAVVTELEPIPLAGMKEPIPAIEEEPIQVEEVAVEEEVIVEEVVTALPKRNWEQNEINSLIEQNLFTREDYEYMLSIAGECNLSYEGFHAVASCVMNRIALNSKYNSVREVVTAEGQFTAHNPIGSASYNSLINQNVIDAAVNVLLGDPSSVGDSYYFYCRVNDFDLYVEDECSEFYLVNGNLFVNEANYKYLHNMTTGYQEGDILVCDSNGNWQFQDGTHYVK